MLRFLLIPFWISLQCTHFSAGYVQASTCANQLQLTFHAKATNYYGAVRACQSIGAQLVKVSNAEIIKAINKVRRGKFFIGMRYDGAAWKWTDNSAVRNSNWNPGEPNGWGEDCVVVGLGGNGWSDVTCGSGYYYICQKKHSLSLSLSKPAVINETGSITCRLTSTCRDVQPTWHGPAGKVSQNDKSDIYQVLSKKASELRFTHSTIQHDGRYSCKVGEGSAAVEKGILTNINGSPSIKDVIPDACSRLLRVLWSATKASVNWQHKINVSMVKSNASAETVVSHTPSSTDIQETVLKDLQNTTRYQIQVQACKNPCDDNFLSELVTVTTGGIPNPPISPTSRIYTNRLGSTCIVKWIRPNIVGDNILTYQVTAEGRSNTAEQDQEVIILTYNATDTYSAFRLPPNYNFTVSVQSVACSGFSTSVTATGSCNTPVVAQTTTTTTTAVTTTTILESTKSNSLEYKFDLGSFLIGVSVFVLIVIISSLLWYLYRKREKNVDAAVPPQEEDKKYEFVQGTSGEDVAEVKEVTYSDTCTTNNEKTQGPTNENQAYEVALE